MSILKNRWGIRLLCSDLLRLITLFVVLLSCNSYAQPRLFRKAEIIRVAIESLRDKVSDPRQREQIQRELGQALRGKESFSEKEIADAIRSLRETSEIGWSYNSADLVKQLITAKNINPQRSPAVVSMVAPSGSGPFKKYYKPLRDHPIIQETPKRFNRALHAREMAWDGNDLKLFSKAAAEIDWIQDFYTKLAIEAYKTDPIEGTKLEQICSSIEENPYIVLPSHEKTDLLNRAKKRLVLLEEQELKFTDLNRQVIQAKIEVRLLEEAQSKQEIRFELPNSNRIDPKLAAFLDRAAISRGSELNKRIRFQQSLLQLQEDPAFEPVLDRQHAKLKSAGKTLLTPRNLKSEPLPRMTRQYASVLLSVRITALTAEALGSKVAGLRARAREAQLQKLHQFFKGHIPEAKEYSTEQFGCLFASNAEIQSLRELVVRAQKQQEMREVNTASSLEATRLLPARKRRLAITRATLEQELDKQDRSVADLLVKKFIDRIGDHEADLKELWRLLHQSPEEALADRRGQEDYYNVLSSYELDGLLSPAELKSHKNLSLNGLRFQIDDLHAALGLLREALKSGQELAPQYAEKARRAYSAVWEAQESLEIGLGEHAASAPDKVSSQLKRLGELLPQQPRGPPSRPRQQPAAPRRAAQSFGEPTVRRALALVRELAEALSSGTTNPASR